MLKLYNSKNKKHTKIYLYNLYINRYFYFNNNLIIIP